MNSLEETQRTLLQFLVKDCHVAEDKLNTGARLFTDKLLDSIRIVSILDFCETQFNVKISPFDATPENFDSIEKIADYIQKLKQA